MICVYGRADPAMLIIRIRRILAPLFSRLRIEHFVHYSVPNRIQIKYSVQPEKYQIFYEGQRVDDTSPENGRRSFSRRRRGLPQ